MALHFRQPLRQLCLLHELRHGESRRRTTRPAAVRSRILSTRQSPRLSPRLCATQTEASESPDAATVPETQEWIALIANAEFMFNDVQNESLAEQLREKVRLYGEKKKEVDFFLVPEPAWLDSLYPEKAKLVGRPCVALVSLDPVWMRFMKTRLDRVLEIRLGDLPKEEVVTSSGEIPDFETPKIWRAPYTPYSPGWWEAFYPREDAPEEAAPEEDEGEEESA